MNLDFLTVLTRNKPSAVRITITGFHEFAAHGTSKNVLTLTVNNGNISLGELAWKESLKCQIKILLLRLKNI